MILPGSVWLVTTLACGDDTPSGSGSAEDTTDAPGSGGDAITAADDDADDSADDSAGGTGAPVGAAAGGVVAAIGSGNACPEGWSIVGTYGFDATQAGLCFRPEPGTAAVFPESCPEGWSLVGSAYRAELVSCVSDDEIDVVSASTCPAGWTQAAISDGTPICTRPHAGAVPVTLTHDVMHTPLDVCPGSEPIDGPIGHTCMLPGASVLLRAYDETGLDIDVGTLCPCDYEHVGYAALGSPAVDYAACVAGDERVLAYLHGAADGTPLFVDAPCPEGWISRSVLVDSTRLGTLSFAICEWVDPN
jgi:hypothetical protein